LILIPDASYRLRTCWTNLLYVLCVFLQRCLNLICASIPNSYLNVLEPYLRSNVALGTRQQYVFNLTVPGFPNANLCTSLSPRRAAYKLSVFKVAACKIVRVASPWVDLLGIEVPKDRLFAPVYDKPHSAREGNLSWRFLFGALSTRSFFHHAGYQDNDSCFSCGQREDLEHMFLNCPRLILQRRSTYLGLGQEENHILHGLSNLAAGWQPKPS
jgi:hypothetical protein